MGQNNNPKVDPDDDLDDEITSDEISRIFKNHPQDYIAKLEEIGFIYHDDVADEEQEEADARPLNANQEYLVSFFDGDISLSDKTVEIFLEERRSLNPNYPLIRKYFKQANKYLLSLLLHGLQLYPVSEELLSDLTFFHEYQNILSTVIEYYIVACEKQQNLEYFSELALEFYYATDPEGYDAFYALKEMYPVGTDKRKVVDFLCEIENSDLGERKNDVDF